MNAKLHADTCAEGRPVRRRPRRNCHVLAMKQEQGLTLALPTDCCEVATNWDVPTLRTRLLTVQIEFELHTRVEEKAMGCASEMERTDLVAFDDHLAVGNPDITT